MIKAVVSDRMLMRFSAILEGVDSVRWSYRDHGDEVGLTDALADAEVFVGSRLTPRLASAAPKLRLVQAAGAGTDQIAFSELPAGVAVANAFEHGTSIAEHVMMVTLAMTRDLVNADQGLRRGRWANPMVAPELPLAKTLRGRTLGLVGYGHIGREVARLASSFGMRVVAVKRTPQAADELDFLGDMGDLPRLLSESDVVVVGVPLTDSTRGLIGAEELASMKSDALLVNVARGPVVDEWALYNALADGVIAGAALDVWYQAPPSPGAVALGSSAPFNELSNVVLTPHFSGVTEETFRRRAEVIADNVTRLADGRDLVNVVWQSGS